MAYNSVTGIIAWGQNVTVPDIQRALGTNYTNMSLLCRHNNINMYSRHKPYAFGGILPNSLYGISGMNDDIIIANNFGMTPNIIVKPVYETPDNIAGCVKPWGQWRPPIAEDGEGCRLSDFRGYSTHKVPHIKAIEYSRAIQAGALNNEDPFSATLKFNSNSDNTIVTLNDMHYGDTSIGNMYLTVVIAAYSPKLPGSNVAAYWGVWWIIAQSDITLNDAVKPPIAGSPNSNEISVTVPSLRAIKAYGYETWMFQQYFIAVGFANKWDNDNITGSDRIGSTNVYYYITDNTPLMPLTLINPNMYNDPSYILASAGMPQGDPSNEAKEFPCTVKLYSDTGYSASAECSHGTLNGVSGYHVGINCRVNCDVTNYAAEHADDGYLAFDLTIEIKTASSGKRAKGSVFVLMEKGVAGGPYKLVMASNTKQIQATPGFAKESSQALKDPIDWYILHRNAEYEIEKELMSVTGLNDKKEVGTYEIFIPLDSDENATVTLVELRVLGAPTPRANQGAWVPKIENALLTLVKRN